MEFEYRAFDPPLEKKQVRFLTSRDDFHKSRQTIISTRPTAPIHQHLNELEISFLESDTEITPPLELRKTFNPAQLNNYIFTDNEIPSSPPVKLPQTISKTYPSVITDDVHQPTEDDISKKINSRYQYTSPKIDNHGFFTLPNTGIKTDFHIPTMKTAQPIETPLSTRLTRIDQTLSRKQIVPDSPTPVCHCMANACNSNPKPHENHNNSNNEVKKYRQKNKDKPSISDLYAIIQMQNEQFQALTKQVDRLLNLTQNSITPPKVIESTKDEMHKISIGVMTSFEVVMTKETKINCVDEYIQTSYMRNSQLFNGRMFRDEPRRPNFLDGIKKTTALSSIEVQTDDISCMETRSLIEKLQKTPPVSPQSTIHLDVQDYCEDDTDDDIQPESGCTFYNNVMNRVDKILHAPPLLNNKTHRNKVTVDQMRHMGYGVTETNISKRVTFQEIDSTPVINSREKFTSETSIHIEKLAARYLNKHTEKYSPNVPMDDHRNMSFATRQYMEKHLANRPSVPNNRNGYQNFRRQDPIPQQYGIPQQYVKPSKILDITAIKRQPKLL